MKTMIPLVIVGLSFVAISRAQAQDVEHVVPERWRRTYETGHYAPAVRVGNVLYLSGVVGTSRDGPNDIEAQSRRAFERLNSVLEGAGASLSDVVSLTTYHVDMGETVRPFMAVKDELILEPYPTWTAVGVVRLYGETALLEVAAIAVIRN